MLTKRRGQITWSLPYVRDEDIVNNPFFDSLQQINIAHLSQVQCSALSQVHELGLGFHYEYGDGVKKDISKSIQYYKLAADQGDNRALCNLAMCYENGKGVTKSSEEAFKYFIQWRGNEIVIRLMGT